MKLENLPRNCMEKSNQHIVQNAIFCVQQKKESHTKLELLFLEPNVIFILGWTTTLKIFWATICAVNTERLHNCKQVTTATSWNSELQSHVGQSNPSYYGLQNTFHERIKKTLVGQFPQAETALEIHLGVRPRLEGWFATQPLYSSHMT